MTNEKSQSLSVNCSAINKLPSPRVAILTLIYGTTVLTVDFLASYDVHILIKWRIFHLTLLDLINTFTYVQNTKIAIYLKSFDFSKTFFWLIIPSILFHKYIDMYWFSFKTWRNKDYLIFIIFLSLCILSLTAILFTPSLKLYYSGVKHLPYGVKIEFFILQSIWIISWLPAWEILNRHILLRSCLALSPRKTWLLILIIETLYHIKKPFLEIIGMGIFSTIATLWTMKRQNNNMAFLCHALIEWGLILLLLFT